jgi:gamma-glutamylcyclotransferase (GGCT)/AIG2-like uncharacterized protein YtfP
MSSASTVKVFAYGSNLHLNRMQQRAPSALPIGIGYVKRRRIAFRKRSVDGSAKADAWFTGRPRDRVWGAIYSVNSRDKFSLDKHESLGVGYDESKIEVHVASGRSMSAFIYEARHEVIDDSLDPYSWYLEFVRHGALQHGLPFCYINQELAIKSIPDPDPDRRTTNKLILSGNASVSAANASVSAAENLRQTRLKK